jgi:hypothetical protein
MVTVEQCDTTSSCSSSRFIAVIYTFAYVVKDGRPFILVKAAAESPPGSSELRRTRLDT